MFQKLQNLKKWKTDFFLKNIKNDFSNDHSYDHFK